jgi:hypothetical protein
MPTDGASRLTKLGNTKPGMPHSQQTGVTGFQRKDDHRRLVSFGL